MTKAAANITYLLAGMGFILLAGLLVWLTLKEDGGAEKPSIEILFSGPKAYAVTPDSTRANPLEAPDPRFASFSMTIESGASLAPGGGLQIEQGYLFQGRPLFGADVRYAFPDPEIHDLAAPNALRVEVENAPFEVDAPSSGLGRKACRVVFPDGLPAHCPVVFHFGDTSAGGPGLAVPTYPLKIRFLTFLDADGGGVYELAEGGHPEIEVFAAGADRFRITGPSVTYSNRIRLRIVPVRGRPGRESSELPVRDFEGEVFLLFKNKAASPSVSLSFKKGERYKDVDFLLPGPGLFRLVAHSRHGAVSGESHPILFPDDDKEAESPLFPEGRRIFWGSLQNHTAIGGHAASLWEEAFRCARKEGALDFCAMTDHSSNPSFQWGELREIPDRFDEPGRFAAFAGYEWTSRLFGHRHVVFREGKDTFACSEEPTEDPFEKYAPDLVALAQHVGHDPNALIIMHHTRRILDRDVPKFIFGKPGELPRQILFEIFSWQGSGEGIPEDLPVQGIMEKTHRYGSGFRDAMQMGHCFGVTADSDQHLGLPGIPVSLRRKNGLRYGFSGLTAVLAPALDRDHVFHALEERQCYGTTGARILLLFKVGVGGMGREAVSFSENLRIQAFAAGTAPIRRMQVIADGADVIHESSPSSLEASLDFTITLGKEKTLRSFYLRLEQEDGHLAWSSPVWIAKKD